jgi:hypothetical protein
MNRVLSVLSLPASNALAFCAIVLGLLASESSTAFGQQYPFLPVAGSPKGSNGMFQDSRGRLWLAGQEPAWFDGTRFFSLRDYGFPAGAANNFSEDPSGAIWIAAETGVYRFANGKIDELGKGFAVSVITSTADLAVAVMGPVGQGWPRVATLFRIARAAGQWKTESVMGLDSPGPLTLDSNGMLLYAVPGKGWSEIRMADVAPWRAGSKLPVTLHSIPDFPSNGNTKVLRDRSGCLWFGGLGGLGYDCGDGVNNAPFAGAKTRPNLHEGSDGTMLLWGDSLLALGRPGSFRVATRANGLPALLDATQGRDGTVWIVTSNGLYRLPSPFRIEYWTIREGLADVPWSIVRAGGRIYAGLAGAMVVALSKDRLRWDTIANFRDGGSVSGLLDAKDGTLLASFIGGGAVHFLGTNGKVLARTETGRPKGIMRLARTRNGEMWLGGRELGRVTRQGEALEVENHLLQTNPAHNVLAIKYEDHTRKLWACYNGGLVVRDQHGSWKEFTTRDGLLTNGCWSLAPLPNGDIWYAYFNLPALALIRPTASGGITVRQYDRKDGILEPGGDTLDADRRGWLWRAGDLGFYVADEAEAEVGKWLQLNQADGFPANGMNSGSVFVDDDGRYGGAPITIWLTTPLLQIW